MPVTIPADVAAQVARLLTPHGAVERCHTTSGSEVVKFTPVTAEGHRTAFNITITKVRS